MEYSNFNQIAIAKDDYSTELFDILKLVAENYKERISQNLSENHKGKTLLLIALPRLSLSNKKRLGEEISLLIDQITKINPNTYYVLKPHPRDLPQDFNFLNDIISMHSNWEFLPSFASCLPIEVIAISLGARIILSGWSTIGINQDLLPGTNVMIYEFLGFDIPHYNDHAKRLMIKSGTFSGKTAQDAVEKVKFLLSN